MQAKPYVRKPRVHTNIFIVITIIIRMILIIEKNDAETNNLKYLERQTLYTSQGFSESIFFHFSQRYTRWKQHEQLKCGYYYTSGKSNVWKDWTSDKVWTPETIKSDTNKETSANFCQKKCWRDKVLSQTTSACIMMVSGAGWKWPQERAIRPTEHETKLRTDCTKRPEDNTRSLPDGRRWLIDSAQQPAWLGSWEAVHAPAFSLPGAAQPDVSGRAVWCGLIGAASFCPRNGSCNAGTRKDKLRQKSFVTKLYLVNTSSDKS